MDSHQVLAGAGTAPNALARLSAEELLAGYKARRFTPRDVLEEVISALQHIDGQCRVMVTPMFDAARQAADAAGAAWAAGTPTGPLCGVPVTIKDLVFVAGVPAHGGAPLNDGFVPKTDAAVVAALRSAGAVLTCKTTTCESGYKLTADSPVSGTTRNPWNLSRTSGGSSGGAAAAVAAGGGPLAIGTDGVGSIRVPSAFCGVFGLKPTFGLVPRVPGFSPPSWASLAHTGPITRTVSDAALLLNVIAGYDPRDGASLPVPKPTFRSESRPLAGLRIAATPDLGYAAVSPAVRAAFEAAVGVLAQLGATVEPLSPELDPQMLERTLKPIAFTEQAAAVAGRPTEDLADSDADYRDVVLQGRGYSGTDYIEATYRRGAVRSAFLALFQKAEALVTPSVAVTAFEAGTLGVDSIDGTAVDRHLGWSPFSWPINLAGLPAATLPCGFDAEGLPIGLQIVAPWLDEAVIFQIAAAFEAARPWAGLWPPASPPQS
ncbi:amidase [Labrys monachus]|uniref:Aspartyl-tRNA(Asn)/glutamyl-tRNA(Gln) amidotransferase subunit A n=1 Tax=Labrys monachus TaxID=217067 RepID=A0ABU0F916_9HYPH|nr:amidase family protein [Labrys monachus]MDQ0391104.1 aspartyl-tRNA(Asn)/glutamyl-tRNA(Gln) amidotransferase subunit A [Labrys monachus]